MCPSRVARMARGRGRAAVLRGVALVALVALVVLWLLRPWFHGLVMFFWTAPLVWLPPLVVLGIGIALSVRAGHAQQAKRIWPRRRELPTVMLVAAGAAFLLFLLGAVFNSALVK